MSAYGTGMSLLKQFEQGHVGRNAGALVTAFSTFAGYGDPLSVEQLSSRSISDEWLALDGIKNEEAIRKRCVAEIRAAILAKPRTTFQGVLLSHIYVTWDEDPFHFSEGDWERLDSRIKKMDFGEFRQLFHPVRFFPS